ncbi:MAG: nucleotidyltransferase substrate binding protein, partial [Aquificaceae bacterium]
MSQRRIFIEKLAKAIERLEEVLKPEKNSVVRDSAIQRFEFTFDLAWK